MPNAEVGGSNSRAPTNSVHPDHRQAVANSAPFARLRPQHRIACSAPKIRDFPLNRAGADRSLICDRLPRRRGARDAN